MDKSAVISDCGRYRYHLSRSWDTTLPRMGIIMLNPSTADADVDDPTIRRVIGFASTYGYGRVDVCNLFPLRCSEPEGLLDPPEPLHHTLNETHLAIRIMLLHVDKVVFAWGNKRFATLRDRANQIVRLVIDYHDTPAWCFKRNADGTPAHPLYLPGDTQLIKWEGYHE